MRAIWLHRLPDLPPYRTGQLAQLRRLMLDIHYETAATGFEWTWPRARSVPKFTEGGTASRLCRQAGRG
jgi:hypothetical protein